MSELTDEEIKEACAEALDWKHLGAVGVTLPRGFSPSTVDAWLEAHNATGKLWCLSGGNDWWSDPEGNKVCGKCQSIPDPLHDDAQAMALLRRHTLYIDNRQGPKGTIWIVNFDFNTVPGAISEDLNRAICECVARMQLAKRTRQTAAGA